VFARLYSDLYPGQDIQIYSLAAVNNAAVEFIPRLMTPFLPFRGDLFSSSGIRVSCNDAFDVDNEMIM